MDKYNNEPIYLAVAKTIREKILNGEYLPGDMIPTEKELCAQFGATRATVRKGLNELENLGFIHTTPGKGCSVLPPKMNQFMYEIRDEYPECTIDPIRVKRISPNAEIKRALRLQDGEKAVECTRIVRYRGLAFVVDHNFAPNDPSRTLEELANECSVFPKINARSEKPYAFFVHTYINAELPPKRIAELMEIEPDRPLIVVTRFLVGPDNMRRAYGRKYILGSTDELRASCTYFPQEEHSTAIGMFYTR